ncbi:hypothetical protein PV325_011518 [Microctonus aethiopoides]|nr:hypothetical protein PV325_011518 [Microctonus aethiopoides]
MNRKTVYLIFLKINRASNSRGSVAQELSQAWTSIEYPRLGCSRTGQSSDQHRKAEARLLKNCPKLGPASNSRGSVAQGLAQAQTSIE